VDEQGVLLIGNNPALRQDVSGFLQSRGYSYVVARSIDEALQPLASKSFRFTLLDLTANGIDPGLVACLRDQGRDPGALIAVVKGTDYSKADPISLVADAVVFEPFTDDDVEAAINGVALSSPMTSAKLAASNATTIQHELNLWRSPKMRDVVDIVRETARVDITVLITGETGTGKGVVARAIHYLSPRRFGPFVKVNCAAVPRDLLESELFGHERGAFTGAVTLKVGKFESANRGTIFLDEIGDLHPDLQGKLLHVLEDGAFSRVGAKSALKVDVRVLAATNQDLERAVAEGRFRDDLYYRLNVVQVPVPPLRERPEEIPLLIEHFVHVYSKLFRRDGFSIPPSVMERLVRYRFPGNVRELENLVKRMIVLGDPFLARVPLEIWATPRNSKSSGRVLAVDRPLKEIGRTAALAAQRDAITQVLEQTGWNRVRAAKTLRVSYRALLYKMKETGLGNSPRRGWVTDHGESIA
jgi:two-component system response regulator AtoC